MSQQRSHVPKFGNWDSENVPYTAYFDNARKEKGSGVKMNPNDPEENPEAFAFGRVGGRSDGISDAVRAPVRVSPDKSTSVEKHHTEGLKEHKKHLRNTSDHQKSGSYRSVTSESGSERSNSDHSLQRANNRPAKATRKKSMTDVNNFIPSSPGPDRRRNPRNPSDDMSHRLASVPKFGAWDESDPNSGEGFTVIFNKVKEEKQIAASKFPMVPPQPSNNTNSQKKDTRSKICCCLF